MKTENELRYDANALRFIKQKPVLAYILKGVVREFADMEIADIISCIEGEPSIQEISVDANGKDMSFFVNGCNEISGMDSSDKSRDEGNVYFDVIFFVRIPEKAGLRKMIINIEAQNEVKRLGYDIVTRGVYYASRNISNQKNTEFSGSNYQDIKKVYSIWICLNSVPDAENTITEYSLEKKDIVGHYPRDDYYDLLSVVQVNLSRIPLVAENDGEKMLRLLEVFFSPDMPVEEKRNVICNEYKIPYSYEVGRSVSSMCNASQGIKNDGIRQGIQQGIQQGFVEGIQSLVEATTYAKENGCTDKSQLTSAGYSIEVAEAVMKLL